MSKKRQRKKKEDNRPFAEKHPRLNLLLGCLILLFGVCVVIGVISLIIKVGAKALKWATETISTLDTVIIVALITGAISIFSVVMSSVVAKNIDYRRSKREYLTQKRELPYSDFVEMIYKLQQNTKTNNSYTQEEMIKDLMSFSRQITLWGSSKVVNDWVKFKECAMGKHEGTEILFLAENLMNDMRIDLGLKKVKKGNLLAFFINDIKQAMRKN